MTEGIHIRLLTVPVEMDAAVELQKIYWGEDMSNLVPAHMLLSIARHGGHIHGAYDGNTLVGIVIGFLGADYDGDAAVGASDRLLLMSKRMVVLPEYRSKKIGEDLKRAQRDFALRHGVQLVTWTFDPLLARNAYLNLHKLRAVGQYYVEDYFGGGASSSVMSADRLVANWWVSHPHSDGHDLADATNAPIVNPISSDAELALPTDFVIADAAVLRLEIPVDFQALEAEHVAHAQEWRRYVRMAFQQLLGAGYLATDMLRSGNRVFYVFTRDDGTFDFQ
jgi:predicted GNAT superfamily acetyltransferase